MFYVCDKGPEPVRILAGPYQSEPEANVAAARIEDNCPKYRERTFISTGLPTGDSDNLDHGAEPGPSDLFGKKR
jgi:hypothetical protein